MGCSRSWSGVAAGCLIGLLSLAGCSTSLSRGGGQSDSGAADARTDLAGDGAAAGCAAPSVASTYQDPTCGCPRGQVCVVEIGGLAGGGGSFCSPVPDACEGVPSCACMEACACSTFFGRNLSCAEQMGTIACDNGIR